VLGLGAAVLGLAWEPALGLAGFAAAMFLVVAWLPETGGRVNTALHVR
jgi:hypothetical protein